MERTNWKWFRVGDLFSLQKCKCSNATELLEEGNEIAYIGAKKSANGVMQYVKRVEELVTRGNCVVFIGDGQGSVGYCIYQPVDFIGSTTLMAGYNKHINPYTATFLISVLDKERYRYSFGRKYKKEIIANSKIQLPANEKNEPDWEYMESFIKNNITPKLAQRNNLIWKKQYNLQPLNPVPLKLSYRKWKEFSLKDFLTIKRGKTLNSELKEDLQGSIPCVNGTSTDNGILCYLNEEIESFGFKKQVVPSLSLCRVGTSGLTFVQPKPYYIADNAFCLLLKEQRSVFVYMFLSTILNMECYKYSYGRTISSEKYMETIIRLPVIPNTTTPDWQFMEDYIKSLPYSRNI